jgi:ketosteroid isomerase-like protein
MILNRRLMAGAALALATLPVAGILPAQAASTDESAVAKRLEAFRAAQAAHDAKMLTSLCAPELSYSHSDAHIEDRATFVANATNPKSRMLSLEYKDPSIRIVGDAAIVRFHWIGKSEAVADGKISDTNLHILMVWQKQAGVWKLLARCSTKL